MEKKKNRTMKHRRINATHTLSVMRILSSRLQTYIIVSQHKTKERWSHCCLSAEKWWRAGNWKHARFADVFLGPNMQLQTNSPGPLVDYRFTGLWTLPTGLEIAANCSFQLALCFEFPKNAASTQPFLKDFHISSQLSNNKSPWAGARGVT